MDIREYLRAYRVIQDSGVLKPPCPRCGGEMENDNGENALSRHWDVYICSDCGREEALADIIEEEKPVEEWYAVRLLATSSEIPRKQNGYELDIVNKLEITDEDIDVILSMALEGGITHWCSKVEVVGEYLGKYTSDQISRGGILILHDMEDGKRYELTREKLLSGLQKYLQEHSAVICGQGIDTGEIDALEADRIVQLALFEEVIYG